MSDGIDERHAEKPWRTPWTRQLSRHVARPAADPHDERAARRFVGETTFAGLSRRHVLTDEPDPSGPIYPHLDAARRTRAARLDRR